MAKLKRIEKIRNTVKSSKTETQRLARESVLKRIESYLRESENEEEFFDKVLPDWDAWCAWYLDSDMGEVFIPAPWQSDLHKKLTDKPNYMGFHSRRMGKTSGIAAELVWRCDAWPRIVGKWWKMNIFVPAKRQDFIFKMVRRFIEGSEELYDRLIGESGLCTAESIRTIEGCELRNYTIGLASKGKHARGVSDSVVIDEVQLVDREVLTTVINPILADAYGDKHMWMIGTPSFDANPELESMFNDNGQKDNWATFRTDWIRGVDEGCLNAERIREQMTKMTPDQIDSEFNALFPQRASRFFGRKELDWCGRDGLGWEDGPDGSSQYGMSVDWAQARDRTEILIGKKLADGKLRYCYWFRIDPKVDGKVPYEKQIEFVKGVYAKFRPQFVIYDATGFQKDLFGPRLMEEPNKIPPAVIYSADAGETFGHQATGETNYEMWINHRRLINNRLIEVPKVHPFFHDVWMRQHFELNQRSGHGGRYIILEEPKSGFKDFAYAAAMLSKWMVENLEVPAAAIVSRW